MLAQHVSEHEKSSLGLSGLFRTHVESSRLHWRVTSPILDESVNMQVPEFLSH